jgi:hypothetical protein
MRIVISLKDETNKENIEPGGLGGRRTTKYQAGRLLVSNIVMQGGNI